MEHQQHNLNQSIQTHKEMMKKLKIDVDLDIFNSQITNANKCESNNDNEDPITTCIALQRINYALLYYNRLNIITNQKHQQLFDHFMNEIYYNIINDFIHLNNKHSHQLEYINNNLKPCNINECKCTTRHHGSNNNKNALNPTLNFYKKTMDGMHFYLYHCFDVGLRIKRKELENKTEEKEYKKDNKFFDAPFLRLHKAITQRQHITKSFNRFSTHKNNKFTIKTQEKLAESNVTDLDEFYEYFESNNNNNISITDIKKLNAFISNEEYESECIEYDLNILNGNIIKSIKNKWFKNELENFIKQNQISSQSFAVGMRFYYWNYFKNKTELTNDEQGMGDSITGINNYICHNGYKLIDLFINKKHSNFKDEIREYKYLIMKEYNNNVLVKVNKYIISDRVKKTTRISRARNPYVKHYGIKKGDKLSYNHLVSMVLYCDYSELSSDFSNTFRKCKKYESIKSIKKRNQNYYYFSKYLREVVECYGQCSELKQDKTGKYYSDLLGPYYCGMNCILNIPSFNIRLYSPTSTSIHIEVAMKFGGPNGMILQFNNPYDTEPHEFLRGFDMSWISQYKEEDERLWFGGFYPIQLQSVRIKHTGNNYKEFIYSLWCLDCYISGAQLEYGEAKINENDILFINNLFFKILNKFTPYTFDNYTINNFMAFIQNKKQIVLELHQLYQYGNEEFRDILMYKMKQQNAKEDQKKDVFISDDDYSNLFVLDMLIIFKNVNTLIIKTTALEGILYYPLSMIYLLSLISSSSSVNKVIVKADTCNAINKYHRFNWIDLLWKSNNERIKQHYKAKNYNISIKSVQISPWNEEYWFEINKGC